METRLYNVLGCKVVDNPIEIREQVEFSQPCGSVTEICKFLKKMYDFSEKECRKLIYTAFARDTKLWIQVNREQSVRISIHKMDGEVRLHGYW